MPNVDYLVLMDKIHLAAYAYVLVGLGVVLSTVRCLDEQAIEQAQSLQRRAYWMATVLFLIAIITMIGVAIFRG
jgi:type IV secretory pathway component VirB8